MKTITVRGIDSALAARLQQEAEKQAKSVNQVVLDALKSQFRLNKIKKFTMIHHDLDHLFGTWSQAEYDQIQGQIDDGRKIDAELWQ